MTSGRVLQLNPRDNVPVALDDLRKGEQIGFSGRTLTLRTDVPAKHKFATEDVPPGGAVVMYGVLIGKAMEPISSGEKLTTRNTRHEAATFHEKTEDYRWASPDVSRWRQKTFLGYFRDDGQVGTRNYWLVVPLGFCGKRNVSVLKQAFEEELGIALQPIYRPARVDLLRSYLSRGSAESKTFSAAIRSGQRQR